VQLRLTIQLRFRLQPGAGRAQGRDVHHPGELGFGVADPAQNYTLQEWQLLINTHDGLTSSPSASAARRGRRSSPTWPPRSRRRPTAGRPTPSSIRKGIKFSNGQVLKPSDFVTTFERQFTVPGPTSFYSGIVGASACKPSHCDLSKGVVADDAASTLTIHLTAADPEFLDKLALPFAYAVPKARR
jgi:peptide/nickel transport system substrate-binding protein